MPTTDVPSRCYMDSLGLTTLWIQQAQSTPTVLREKMKASSQRGILNAVKMMNSLKDNSKILSYLSRNIVHTYISNSRQAGIRYGQSCSMVLWYPNNQHWNLQVIFASQYILSNKTEHIPQKPWSFLFPPCNYKAYWMQPGFVDWPYCFWKRCRQHCVLFLLNSIPLHGARQTVAWISLSSFLNK